MKENAQLLENARKSCGKTKTYLATKLNISRPYLYKLMANPELCTYNQASMLCKELDIKSKTDRDNIFLPSM